MPPVAMAPRVCQPQPPRVPQLRSRTLLAATSRSSSRVYVQVPKSVQALPPQSAGPVQGVVGSLEQRSHVSDGSPCVHGLVVAPEQKPSRRLLKFLSSPHSAMAIEVLGREPFWIPEVKPPSFVSKFHGERRLAVVLNPPAVAFEYERVSKL